MTTTENKYILQLATSKIKEDLKRIEEINQELKEIDNKEKKRERDLEINTINLGDVRV